MMRHVSYDSFVCYAETKEMIYEPVNLKRVVYEPKQNFLSLHVKALQTLALSFIKFIHSALNKFSTELYRKLVQSSVN